MFARKTVFVVGAGASHEVGLPVGSALTGIIGNKLNITENGAWDSTGDTHVVRALANLARGSSYGSIMRRYASAARAISSAMPQAISIDNFLHTHANDEDIVMLGKFGIAASIIEAERRSHIFRKDQGRHSIDFGSVSSWHNTFCKMMTENVQRQDLDSIFDNVAFITFNYDRCIEHYLSMWLSNYMRISLEESYQLCSKLSIFHPYGQVGKLPWQTPDGTGVPFGDDLSEHNIIHTAKQIRTFTERVDDDAMLAEMRRTISEAVDIIYLGFAYAKMNMDLMRLDNPGGPKRVFATTFGMSAPNKENAIGRVEYAMSTSGSGGHMIKRSSYQSVTANQLLADHWYDLSE